MTGPGRYRNLDYATMRSDLEEALDNNELYLKYQPVLSVKEGRAEGAEALLRWNHPRWGEVSPRIFLSVAEAIGLTFSITETILRMQCRQGVDWVMEGLPPLRMCVNISPAQLGSIALADIVERVLGETGFPAERLIVEVAESSLQENAEDIVPVVGAIRELGVNMCIDDFGMHTGSMTCLGAFSPHAVKLAGTIAQDVLESPHAHAMVHAIQSYGQEMGMKVVMKGIETTEQLAFVHEHGIELAQGFMISRPLASDEFANWHRECCSWCGTTA